MLRRGGGPSLSASAADKRRPALPGVGPRSIQLARWWWDLAKARPLVGGIMLILILIVVFVLMSFLSILVVLAMLAAGVVLVAAGVTACSAYMKK